MRNQTSCFFQLFPDLGTWTKVLKVTPSHRQPRPTGQDNCPLCLQHHGCQCHSGTDIQLRSPWVDPGSPSIRLLLGVPSHLRSSSQAMECAEVVSLERSQDSVGLWYDDSQNHGNNVCHEVIRGLQQRENEWERHPTVNG